MITIVYACGFFSVLLAIFHILFWKLFAWQKDLQKLSFANQAIMQIMNLRLIYLFFFIAFMCFYFPEELVTTTLGKAFMIGCSLFWLGRTIEQFIFININHIKVHLLTAVFLLGTILFLIPIV